jgi:hypothetical protein
MTNEQGAPLNSRRRRSFLGILIGAGGLLVAAPAFADSPPNVWEMSDVYSVGAMVDGGSLPSVYYDTWHHASFLRDGDTNQILIDSAHDGLGRHNFWISMPDPNVRHAWVSGQTCWHTLVGTTSCGPWSEWRSVTANERPGAPGQIKGNGNMCVDDTAHINYCGSGANQQWHPNQWNQFQSSTGKSLTYHGPTNGAQVTSDGPIDNMIQDWDFTNARIKGLRSMCMDATNANPSTGTQAQFWDCNDSGAQNFTFVGYSHEIRGPGGKCLDVYSFGTANGTPVKLWDCNGLDNQKFYIGWNGEIRGWGNKCLEVAGIDINNGAKLQTWDCWGGTNQKFWIEGELRSYQNNCLELPGQNTSPGTNLQTWDCWGGSNQHWSYTP